MEPAIRVGIIGVGGFAARHHETAFQLEKDGECRVVATCDPSSELLAEAGTKWDFGGRGVRSFSDYREMLDACGEEMDLVVISTPIPLHAEMHRACVERGVTVYLEKPPTLDPVEFDEMIEVDREAKLRTTVGFNLVADENRMALKRRLLSGEFGALREVRFRGFAPRATSYFQRARWAARLKLDGRRVLDSCFGNAMAHYVHNALLWSGTESVETSAGVASVEAELYRAHEIEGADTFFVSVKTDTGVRLRIGMTHACADVTLQEEQLVCDRATITYRVGKAFEIVWKEGTAETGELPKSSGLLGASHVACYQYLRGERDRPLTSLADCRSLVQLNALAYVSAGRIVSVPETECETVKGEGGTEGMTFVGIRDIAPSISLFVETGRFPSQAGAGWGESFERTAEPGDIGRLEELGF